MLDSSAMDMLPKGALVFQEMALSLLIRDQIDIFRIVAFLTSPVILLIYEPF